MACNITSGIGLDCIDGIGGIKTVWIGTGLTFSSTNAYTLTNGVITAIGTTGSTGSFYKFDLPKDTGSFTETYNVSNTNGTTFYKQELSINIQKLTATKRNQLLLLSKSRDIKCVILDNNGVYWFLGIDRGGTVTAGTSVTGVAPGDQNGYTITISADEPNMAPQLTSLTTLTPPFTVSSVTTL